MTRARLAGIAATCLLAAGFAACSDPGSGGTGVPEAALTPGDVVSGPAPAAPGVDGACAVPPNADAGAFVGTIVARTGACLQVDERRVDITRARIEGVDGEPVGVDALTVGRRVSVSPSAGDPSRAESVRLLAP
ncbi:MAG: hypothetical protein AB7P21_06930 [Lautropia sp.]